jgi:hypothetical protein
MPTKLPRVSVTKDPELERALALTRGAAELMDLSEAAQVRALALRGAETLLGVTEVDRTRRALAQAGAKLSSTDLVETSRRVRGRAGYTPIESGSEALRWARGDER